MVSHIRMGESIHAPLIPTNQADLVVALERHEALRGAATAAKNGATLIYYNTVWQPLDVRLNMPGETGEEDIRQYCRERNIREIKIFNADLTDARMQNIVLLSGICENSLIPGIAESHYISAMNDLMSGSILEQNLALFKK